MSRVKQAVAWMIIVSFVMLVFDTKAAPVELDERPSIPGEWGYRPVDESVTEVTPPSFSWRPQDKVSRWQLQCARDQAFRDVAYDADHIGMNVHCPPQPFPQGTYFWRYRGMGEEGPLTGWSRVRRFTIAADAQPMPMPPREELLSRIPKSHPRLFVRPEDIPRLRTLVQGPLRAAYQEMQAECDRLLASPPPTAEPPKYPDGMVRGSDPWRDMWWGNRRYTIRALNGAATLAFAYQLSGRKEYADLAKRILMDCAQWDPRGSTGYRYNDEAGMPYAYYFSRAYTFLHDQLNEEQRAQCRRVMKVRGEEMYRHLYPRHLWRPYSSHSNRAWHFLGEVGIAFLDEIEEADDWVWFAMNVFYNVYPVWCDDEGGWHEGTSYWSSYISRFTWWADVMRAAMGINAYEKPYFRRCGYYAMYLMPPGKVGGGFGDLTAGRRSEQMVPLVSQLAAQASNGHWQWYVKQMGGPAPADGYVGLVRGMLPEVNPVTPDDLPPSRVFRGTGQAVLNTTLFDAGQAVQVVFKSSPFGTQSHGYEANNSFLLWAYGQRLLIRSGYRDSYGSDHHRHWMWSTRSVNNITVDGQGQLPHSALSRGQIVDFQTTPHLDLVTGEAGDTYRTGPDDPSLLKRFTRTLIFAKPDALIVYDRLVATQARTFEYWLHATKRFEGSDPTDLHLSVGDVRCDIRLLTPSTLTLSQTDQYDPNPRPRITLREWHLTAKTTEPADRIEFVAVYQPFRATDKPLPAPQLETQTGGYRLDMPLRHGRLVALLPRDDTIRVQDTDGTVVERVTVRRFQADGTLQAIVTASR